MRRSIGVLYVVSCIAGIVSATCFAVQNGFGGGHGDWDLVLWLLSLPWALISWPDVVQENDLVRLTLLPFVCNMIVITLLREALERVMRSRSAPNA